MEIRKLSNAEKAEAAKRASDVFFMFVAPDYKEEGVDTFRRFIQKEEAINGLEMYAEYEEGALAGVIATRNEGSHIALFFVDKQYHRQGIGRQLFEEVIKNCTSKVITVYSSPYAVEIYHKLGFTDTDAELTKDGIRYTPMQYQK